MAKLELWYYKLCNYRLAGVRVTLSSGLTSPIFRTEAANEMVKDRSLTVKHSTNIVWPNKPSDENTSPILKKPSFYAHDNFFNKTQRFSSMKRLIFWEKSLIFLGTCPVQTKFCTQDFR